MRIKHLGIITSLMVISFISCEEILEQYPESQIVLETFYKTKQDAVMATNGVYDALGYGEVYGQYSWHVDIQGEIAGFGLRPSDHPEHARFDFFSYTYEDWRLALYYSRRYIVINRANMVSAYVPGINMDSQLRDRLVAEAKFIRAFMYFDLVRVFGQVPLILEPQLDYTYKPSQNSIPEIYDAILNDLWEAKNVLPDLQEEVGRATKGAANGFLAKVYMTLAGTPVYKDIFGELNQYELYDSAAYYAKKVIEGSYNLLPFEDRGGKNYDGGYADIFRIDNSSESIFEVQFLMETTQYPDQGSRRYFDQGGEGNTRAKELGVRTSGNGLVGPGIEKIGGYGFFTPTKEFVEGYETGDSIRKYITVWDNGDVSPLEGNDYTWPDYNNADQGFYPNGYATKKFFWYEFSQWNMGGGNHIVLRLADVYLLYAEAINMRDKQPNDEAYTYLNKVRQRVLLPPLNGLSYKDFRKAVYNERKYELAFEGQNWWDLIRQPGIDNEEITLAEEILSQHEEVYNKVILNFEAPKHLLWPVPKEAMDVNPSLVQTAPGWK